MSDHSDLYDAYPNSLTGFSEPATTHFARLFRQILLDTNMTAEKWRLLQKHYVNDPRNKVLVDVYSAKRAALTKLRRRLANPCMGRKSFAIALKFLNPTASRAAKNGIELTWPDGRKTIHTVAPIDPQQ